MYTLDRDELDRILLEKFPEKYTGEIRDVVLMFPSAEETKSQQAPDWAPQAHKSMSVWIKYLRKHYPLAAAAINIGAALLIGLCYLVWFIIIGMIM